MGDPNDFDPDGVTPVDLPDATPFALTHAQRVALFGHVSFIPDPRADNPEHVRIPPAWTNANLTNVPLPLPGNHHAIVHRLIADQFTRLWLAWSREGLLPFVLSFDGAWVPRLKRGRAGGTEADLSNHAWGTAFDVNAQWNRLGSQPAPLNGKGTVLPLVTLAEQHGFVWGGTFKSRVDAMHFEAYRIIGK